MKWKGEDGTLRHQFHPLAWDPYRAGNLYVLDMSLNRWGGKRWPAEKLEKYRKKLWPKTLFLSAEEDASLLRSVELLVEKKDVPAGMDAFHEYIVSRELRIFHEVREHFPRAFAFAADDPASGA